MVQQQLPQKILLKELGQDMTLQPCHLCKRFLPTHYFAANQCLDSHIELNKRKSSKHSLPWRLEYGFAAGCYVKGQLTKYRANFSGIVGGELYERCGAFMRVREYYEMGDIYQKNVEGRGRVRDGWSSMGMKESPKWEGSSWF